MDLIEEEVLRELERIPAEKRPEVLKTVQELRRQYAPEFKFTSVEGLWSDCGIDLSGEEIDELRREMWTPSPRGGD